MVKHFEYIDNKLIIFFNYPLGAKSIDIENVDELKDYVPENSKITFDDYKKCYENYNIIIKCIKTIFDNCGHMLLPLRLKFIDEYRLVIKNIDPHFFNEEYINQLDFLLKKLKTIDLTNK